MAFLSRCLSSWSRFRSLLAAGIRVDGAGAGATSGRWESMLRREWSVESLATEGATTAPAFGAGETGARGTERPLLLIRRAMGMGVAAPLPGSSSNKAAIDCSGIRCTLSVQTARRVHRLRRVNCVSDDVEHGLSARSRAITPHATRHSPCPDRRAPSCSPTCCRHTPSRPRPSRRRSGESSPQVRQ